MIRNWYKQIPILPSKPKGKIRLNIFYCIFKPADQWGWVTSSHNISYAPPPPKKREITKYINWRQFTKGTRGKPNEQLFPK